MGRKPAGCRRCCCARGSGEVPGVGGKPLSFQIRPLGRLPGAGNPLSAAGNSPGSSRRPGVPEVPGSPIPSRARLRAIPSHFS